MQGELQGDCDKNRSRETANPSDLQRADMGYGTGTSQVWIRADSDFLCQKAALEHHTELLCNRERKNKHTKSSATAARHKSGFDKELQKASVSNA